MPTPRSRIHVRSRRRAAAPLPSSAREALPFCVVPRWSETLPDGRRIDVRLAVSCYENIPLTTLIEADDSRGGWRDLTDYEFTALYRQLRLGVIPALARLQATGVLPAGEDAATAEVRVRLVAASVVTTTSLPRWVRAALKDDLAL
jgi:hypothetical protein